MRWTSCPLTVPGTGASCRSSDVINACDAGREGELIFRNIYQMTGCKKPIYRLWISSMEDNAIEQGFRELKDGNEYDNLFAAARCREWADWLVGINATRLFSVLYHRTLNVGRVVSPTLALLVQREAEIGAFKPEPFYTAELDFGSFTAVSEKFYHCGFCCQRCRLSHGYGDKQSSVQGTNLCQCHYVR